MTFNRLTLKIIYVFFKIKVSQNKSIKEAKQETEINNRVIILLTVFFVSTFFFQIIFVENSDGYLYTELQESHMQEGKYKRDDNFWMVRKTEEPLNGLVYDYAENGKKIEFGYLVNGYQDGTWKFFHENGKPSMENIYKNGNFIETTQKWDSDGKLLEDDY